MSDMRQLVRAEELIVVEHVAGESNIFTSRGIYNKKGEMLGGFSSIQEARYRSASYGYQVGEDSVEDLCEDIAGLSIAVNAIKRNKDLSAQEKVKEMQVCVDALVKKTNDRNMAYYERREAGPSKDWKNGWGE